MLSSLRGHENETDDILLTDRSQYRNISEPPSYDEAVKENTTSSMAQGGEGAKSAQWWNPKSWSKVAWIIIGIIIAIIIVVVVVVPVEVTKENAYPSYTTLNYSLSETYSPESFFDNFDYFTDTDPTNGFVTYVSQETAESLNLTYASTSSAVLRVDTSDADDTSDSSDSSDSSSDSDQSSTEGQSGQSSQGGGGGGQGGGGPGRRRRSVATSRNSVRVTSKNQYNKGLFIFDVIHTPFGCGTWPALWFTDLANWPTNGEIDVMEAVNNATSGNQVTLHTKSGCKMDHKRRQTGTTLHENCYWAANDEAGCGVQGNTSTFGDDFNTLGGGVTAVEWRSAGIRVWQFERDNVPDDISNNSPDPTSWGRALADFPDTGCDIGSHFKNQSIIINIDLCGDWAGSTSVYSSEYSCPSNCTDYVANNPSEFTNAYWEFGAFQVYQSS